MLPGKLSDFSMMERKCMGRGKDIRLTFQTRLCENKRKFKVAYLFLEASSGISMTVRIRNIFMAACSERRCIQGTNESNCAPWLRSKIPRAIPWLAACTYMLSSPESVPLYPLSPLPFEHEVTSKLRMVKTN